MKAILNKEFIVNKENDLVQFSILFIVSIIFFEKVEIIKVIVFTILILDTVPLRSNIDYRKENFLINSLAIERRKIVLAKYFHSIWVKSLYLLIISCLFNLYNGFGSFTLNDILLLELSCIMSSCLGYPLRFYKEMLFNVYIYVMISVLLVIQYFFAKSGKEFSMLKLEESIRAIELSHLIIIASFVFLIILPVSYFISVRIYNKKEF
ncbi:ABC-2 transporter permease [Facklamia sp. 7083-14-GEN3]|uniref:ABC-2 transporter permease n=1 Tax=Facklamia sp. 7083-14-GEN3 TaxID=2973478 RepID=UPI00215BEE1C|nr:ABC-2 transporter permease [Facklamia sp. 7083-14-GEN3]MCR8968521.1 ABC-2 transporter permease [Facklamia sp. 7083-14-GEN3]